MLCYINWVLVIAFVHKSRSADLLFHCNEDKSMQLFKCVLLNAHLNRLVESL